MRLQQLLDGSQSSDFIMIQDDKEARGSLLLAEFIKQNVNLQNNTHLLCLENNPDISNHMPSSVNFKIHTFFDCRSWLENKSDHSTNSCNPCKVIEEIQNESKSNGKTVIFIDSLSLFVLFYPDSCYKTIFNLVNHQAKPGKYQQQVVCLLHRDVLPGDEKTLMMYEQLAVTNIIVSCENRKFIATIKHRKASGRVIQNTEHFSINSTEGLVTKEIDNTKENTEKDNKTDWMSNDVTFKLELEDEEKRARSELVLPYLKASQKQSTGEIIYEPDANDDWDEEDPDDDLNI